MCNFNNKLFNHIRVSLTRNSFKLLKFYFSLIFNRVYYYFLLENDISKTLLSNNILNNIIGAFRTGLLKMTKKFGRFLRRSLWTLNFGISWNALYGATEMSIWHISFQNQSYSLNQTNLIQNYMAYNPNISTKKYIPCKVAYDYY